MDQLFRPSMDFQRVQHLASPSKILTPTISRTPKTGFLSLPLEVRQMIYREITQEDQQIFTKGLPAILKVRLQISEEIYSHCTITTTLKAFSPCIHSNPKLTKVENFQKITSNKGLRIYLDWKTPSCLCNTFDWDHWLQEHPLYYSQVPYWAITVARDFVTLLPFCGSKASMFPLRGKCFIDQRGGFESLSRYFIAVETRDLRRKERLSKLLKRFVEGGNVEVLLMP